MKAKPHLPGPQCVDLIDTHSTAGINPRFYSQELMDVTSSIIDSSLPRQNLAEDALHEAWQRNPWPGASTATLAVLAGTSLDVTSLGDCKLIVLRDGKIVFETIPKWHAFNMPQQLGGESPDHPRQADAHFLGVQKGDVVVLGSDGLFDNIALERIVQEAGSLRPTTVDLPNLPRLVSLECGLHESIVVRREARQPMSLREGYDAFIAEANETIGRNAANSVHVNARGISGLHCAIYFADDEEQPRLYVEDMESTNGCYVNGVRITGAHKLQHGDMLTLARPTVEQTREAGLPAYQVDLYWERDHISPEELAERLALTAFQISLDPTAEIPFNQAAREAGQTRVGGKADDITVVVAVVVEEDALTRSFKAASPRPVYEEPGLAGSNNPEHMV